MSIVVCYITTYQITGGFDIVVKSLNKTNFLNAVLYKLYNAPTHPSVRCSLLSNGLFLLPISTCAYSILL